MKEKLEGLKTKLQECSATISELAEFGVNITFSVSTLKKEATFTASTNTTIVITSATTQIEL